MTETIFEQSFCGKCKAISIAFAMGDSAPSNAVHSCPAGWELGSDNCVKKAQYNAIQKALKEAAKL